MVKYKNGFLKFVMLCNFFIGLKLYGNLNFLDINLKNSHEKNYSKNLCYKIKENIDENFDVIAYKKENSNQYIPNIRLYEIYQRYLGCFNEEEQIQQGLATDELRKFTFNFRNTIINDQQNRQARAIAMFNKSKELVLTLIQNLISNNNSLGLFNLNSIISRINSIRLEPIKKCGMFNAAYNPLSHTIYVCSEILDFPDSTLITIISHEIGHSFDPCILQFNLSFIKNENPFFNKNNVIELNELNNSFTTIPSEWAKSDFFIDEENITIFEPAINFLVSPFQKLMVCLESPDSIGATQSITQGICANGNIDGEFQEVFADWISFEALAIYISELNNLSIESKKIIAEEAIMNFPVADCDDIDTQIELQMKQQMLLDKDCNKKTKPYFDQLEAERKEVFTSSHPHAHRRINKLFLAQPIIQNLINLSNNNFEIPRYCHYQ